jgi:addiction module HigA family antidote
MNATSKNQFNPNYAVPPGDILQEWLDDQGLTQAELAQRMGRAKKTVNEIIKGIAPITAVTSLQLEKVTGIEASFWSSLEVNYRAFLARQHERKTHGSDANWLVKFSYTKLAEHGWVPATSDKVERVENLLCFYGVANFQQWEETYSALEGAARESVAFKSELGDLSAWLRRGEIEAAKVECSPFDESKFRAALNEIRSLTGASVREQNEKVPALCAAAGVVLALVPELPKTHVSGFTRWLTPVKALMQLSLRYKRDDQLWFTFFHEAAHILLHGKKERFLEFQGRNDPKENEANDWAADFLIPRSEWNRFIKNYDGATSDSDLRQFAKRLGIAPGIVAGRVQREKKVFNRHHDLFVRLGMAETGERQEGKSQ